MKWWFHSNSMIKAIHRARMGKNGMGRKLVTTSVPGPAKSGAAPDSGANFSSTIFVLVFDGIMRGKFRGSAKKRKTFSNGNGTHCSKRREAMPREYSWMQDDIQSWRSVFDSCE